MYQNKTVDKYSGKMGYNKKSDKKGGSMKKGVGKKRGAASKNY